MSDDPATLLSPAARARVELSLVREWAMHITVPVFLVDPQGTLVYYNEPAEALLGRRFDAAGELPASELSEIFTTTTIEGETIESHELPLSIALLDKRPAHRRMRIVALDRAERLLEVTAFPLLRRDGELLGAVALFWGRPEAGGAG